MNIWTRLSHDMWSLVFLTLQSWIFAKEVFMSKKINYDNLFVACGVFEDEFEEGEEF